MNILFIVSYAGLIVLVLRSLMLSKNAFTYSKYILYTVLHWDITEYPCRLQDMSRLQGIHIKGFYCTCLQFNVLHGSCGEGLHFSALVMIVFSKWMMTK